MKDFKNILFINYGGIGDEILFLSAIQSVKNCYNSAKITLALEPRAKSVKSLTNSIDEVICVDIKAQGFKKYFNIIKFILKTWFKGFDCVISSGKSPFVAIILFLTFIKTKIGYESKFDFLLTHRIKLNENQYAAKMYHDLVAPIVNCEYQNPQITVNGDFSLPNGFKKGEYILIHPGVSKMSIKKNILKCPDVSFWQSVITGLLDKNRQVVLLGTNDDEDIIQQILRDDKIKNNPNFINYFSKTKSLMEMAFLMKNSFGVICADSAPLHCAVGVGANIYAIFGPTNEKKLVPDISGIVIIKNEVECRPCLWHKRSQNCKENECLKIDPKILLNKIN